MSSIIITRTTPTATAPYYSCGYSSNSSHNSTSSVVTQSGAKGYRIEVEERRRRTVFVKSNVPPEQWETHQILDIADIEEGDEQGLEGESKVHRSKSLSERPRVIGAMVVDSKRSRSGQDLPSNQHAQPRYSPGSDPSSQSSSRYQSRRASLKPSDALTSATAAFNRMSATPNTPPNSPAVWKSHNSVTRNNLSSETHRSRPMTMEVAVPPRPRILFYHKHNPHYGFTNFSRHSVDYMGKRYPTSEHLFQSFKACAEGPRHRLLIAEHIRTCSERPSIAFSEARKFQSEVRPDWKKINVEKMDVTLYHKFTQHPDLMNELLATGNAELVEDSDKDAFWGIGADGRGRNELGKALERLREQFRAD
ncbi:hypothetical protein DFJ43DRAFT_1154051 [Lentinula guzmanii]|uniref:NADAR domain-containing protein n=1 Tax=Lentinula guzmanii TaxID=2804957 RepID=A0AA38JAQ8_9AGAR|nr:hypothetical protein DFJ43DRAFT_1154051 [Lentinula guzmanii]